MKMVHFGKNSGLSPRPYDAYDDVCERYFRAFFSNAPNAYKVRRDCENTLRDRFGSSCFDTDYTHGRNLVKFYTVTNV